MGGGDSADTEEGYEELGVGRGCGWRRIVESAAAGDTVRSRQSCGFRSGEYRVVVQRYGGVCGGPSRASRYSVSAVGEPGSAGAQAAVGYEGASVGVAAAVAFDPAWFGVCWSIYARREWDNAYKMYVYH